MALGGAAGVAGVPLPGVEAGIALSGVVLGLMVVLAASPPLWIAAILVGAFAIFHGHAHGTELPEAADPLVYAVGFVVATGLLHLSGIALGQIGRWPIGRATVRGGGGGDRARRRSLPRRVRMIRLAVLAGTALAATPASAHGAFGSGGGFYAGLLHPALALGHLFALVALGLLFGRRPGAPPARAARRARRRARGRAGARRAGGESAIALAAVLAASLLAGAAVALALPVPTPALLGLAAVSGLAIGADTGAPAASGAAFGYLPQAGVFVGVFLIVSERNGAGLAGRAAGLRHRDAHCRVLARGGGDHDAGLSGAADGWRGVIAALGPRRRALAGVAAAMGLGLLLAMAGGAVTGPGSGETAATRATTPSSPCSGPPGRDIPTACRRSCRRRAPSRTTPPRRRPPRVS